MANSHYLRLSFQSGYRYPSIFEAYSNVNSGGVKRVGGLPVMSNGIFENAWLQSSITAFQQAVLNDINTNGLSQGAAIMHNAGLLKKNPYTYIKPEHVNSIEGGYKGAFASGKLLVDADFYFNSYSSFIAQANMNVPKTKNVDSIAIALYNKTLQSPYRMWTNSQTHVYNYGISAGITFANAGYTANANATYSKLRKSANEDGLEDGFNTPEWMVNLSVSKTNILKNTSAGMSWRWQSSYYWQSFLVNGNVPAYATLDAQVTHVFTRAGVTAKVGANEIASTACVGLRDSLYVLGVGFDVFLAEVGVGLVVSPP
jgi:iron complex outermembrane receptor protein